jgi:multicomponent Na+:H+ antiporter subunit E
MFLVNLVLAVAWCFLTGQFDPLNLAVGFGVGLGMLVPLRSDQRVRRYLHRGPRVVRLIAYVLWELVVANLKMARAVLVTPRDRLRPGIVAVPLDLQSDAQITALANLVTLTPGTLSLDVSSDRRTLYVHAVEVGDPEVFRRDLKAGFERLVREVFE